MEEWLNSWFRIGREYRTRRLRRSDADVTFKIDGCHLTARLHERYIYEGRKNLRCRLSGG